MDASFSIAGLVIRLKVDASPVQRAIEAAWQEFRSSESPEVVLEVELGEPTAQTQRFQQAMPQVEVLPDNSLIVQGHDFSGSINSTRTTAKVSQPVDQRFPLESIAKLLVADYLISRGGLLVHSVGLAHQGSGAIFTGHSGAGKTTLAGLSKEAGLTVLSDELVGVKPDRDEYFAYGTPWNVGFQQKSKLTVMGLLAFDPESRIEVIQPADLLRVLLQNVLMADSTSDGRSRIFLTASRLVRSVGCVRLSFPLSPSVGETIRRELSDRERQRHS